MGNLNVPRNIYHNKVGCCREWTALEMFWPFRVENKKLIEFAY